MAITKDALKTLSVEEVLNINLEEVPDAGFKIWPDGTYHVVFAEPKVEEVGKDKLPRLTIPYVLVEVMELADPESEAVAAESENQLGYMLPGGASMFKMDFSEVLKATGQSTILGACEQLQGYHVSITLGHRADKNDKDRIYQSVKAIAPLV